MFDTTPTGIAALIAQGESGTVEFKRRFASSNSFAFYVIKFANADGGIVLFGVKDTGEILGLSEEEAESTISRVRSSLVSILPSGGRVGVVHIEGKRVVFVEVPASRNSVAYVRATQKQEISRRLNQFGIESLLVLSVFSCLWYSSTLAALRMGNLTGPFLRLFFPQYSLTALGWTDLTLFCFFATIFYGTAYEVTPLKIVGAVFWPFIKLYQRRTREQPSRPPVGDGLELQDASEDLPGSRKVSEPQKMTRQTSQNTEATDTDDIANQNVEASLTLAKTAFLGNEPDALLRGVAERASFFADRMEKRTNTYLVVGVGMGFLGMFFWFWSFNKVLSTPLGPWPFVETAVPRVTILLFIELLAGFFLRQYRIGVEDFKYFFELEQKANWKRITHSILSSAQDPAALKKFAATLPENYSTDRLHTGESTPTLEVLKAEGNFALEAMRLFSNAVQEVAKGFKQRS